MSVIKATLPATAPPITAPGSLRSVGGTAEELVSWEVLEEVEEDSVVWWWLVGVVGGLRRGIGGWLMVDGEFVRKETRL